MLRTVRGPLILFMLFAASTTRASFAQQTRSPAATPTTPAQGPRAQFFSGYIAEFDGASVAVSRKTTGKELLRRVFKKDAKTKVEGNLKTGARVTVRYETTPDGDRAIHIIVRG